MPEPREELTRLRNELDALDRGLLDTARRRADVVRQIALAKRNTEESGHHPLFDRERERAVYARADAYAREIGLDPRCAQALTEAIVEDSHRQQEAVSISAARAQTTRSFVIVGGHGRMGRRLARDLLARGHEVDAYDVDDARDMAGVVAGADIVMLGVPMHAQSEAAAAVGPHVREGGLLCDINSLKSEICDAMLAACPREVVGLHPMFGPTVHTLRRQKFVVCRCRSGAMTDWLVEELAQLGADVIESDPVRHDRMMALVQVLVHFSTLVMGEALRRTGDAFALTVEDSLRFTSPIYRLELAFIGRLFAQDPALYAEIEMTNPHGAEVRGAFLDIADEMRRVVESGDREAFRELFEGVSTYFSGFADEAMRLSDMIIDSMVRQP